MFRCKGKPLRLPGSRATTRVGCLLGAYAPNILGNIYKMPGICQMPGILIRLNLYLTVLRWGFPLALRLAFPSAPVWGSRLEPVLPSVPIR